MQANRLEISRAVSELALDTHSFRIAGEPEAAAAVLQAVEDRFVTRKGLRWWWQAFRDIPTAMAQFEDGSGWRVLDQIVPPETDQVRLIAEGEPEFVVCEGSFDAIQSVIADCFGFEYYVVSKDLDWLICENHHEVVIAVGEQVAQRLRRVIETLTEYFEVAE